MGESKEVVAFCHAAVGVVVVSYQYVVVLAHVVVVLAQVRQP